MFRYAFGRSPFEFTIFTPKAVVKIIKRNKNFLSNRVLARLDMDLAEAAESLQPVE